MSSISGENDRIHRVYRITGVPRTGDIETVVILTVTSEDDIDKTYEITLNRGVTPTKPTVTMSLAPISSISEDGETSTLTATVSPASATAFDVTVTAAPGAAVTMSGTTLSFAANARSATAGVTITAVDNSEDAADQTVTISGTTPSGVTAPAAVRLTITDDDGAATTPRVTMSLDPTRVRFHRGRRNEHIDGEGVACFGHRVRCDGDCDAGRCRNDERNNAELCGERNIAHR